IPAETNRVVQVKYTNPQDREILQLFLIFQAGPTDIGSLGSKMRSGKKYDFWFRRRM
ncbi:unnamed protein product, partial [Chrysoparadoxa australica]